MWWIWKDRNFPLPERNIFQVGEKYFENLNYCFWLLWAIRLIICWRCDAATISIFVNDSAMYLFKASMFFSYILESLSYIRMCNVLQYLSKRNRSIFWQITIKMQKVYTEFTIKTGQIVVSNRNPTPWYNHTLNSLRSNLSSLRQRRYRFFRYFFIVLRIVYHL